MIPSIDVHCHPASYEDHEGYVRARLTQGIRRLGAASTTPADWEKIVRLSEEHEEVWGGLGIHPWHAATLSDTAQEEALETLDSLVARHRGIRFIGECGLDACHLEMERQKRIFEAQIGIARKYGLLIVVHCVKAWHEMPKLLKTYEDVLFHGFCGSEAIQRDVLGRGGCVSLGRAMLRKTPPRLLPELLERAFLETDDDNAHAPISLEDVLKRLPGLNAKAAECLAEKRFMRP